QQVDEMNVQLTQKYSDYLVAADQYLQSWGLNSFIVYKNTKPGEKLVPEKIKITAEIKSQKTTKQQEITTGKQQKIFIAEEKRDLVHIDEIVEQKQSDKT